jgi:hypothetical protein
VAPLRLRSGGGRGGRDRPGAAGEITDKGYVNQRRVLAGRAALVELLHAEPAPAGVIVADPSARSAAGE